MSKPHTLEEVEALLKAAPSTRDRLAQERLRLESEPKKYPLKGNWCPGCGTVDLARHVFCDHELDAIDEARR